MRRPEPDSGILMNRIDRITEMEAAFDRVTTALLSGLPLSPEADDDIEKLKKYYSSDWLEDFQADERGELPDDLKRGVLSEDGLFDLLSEVDRRK